MGERGADARHFVSRDGNANPGTTNGDSQIRLFRGDAFARGFAVIRIIHGFFRRSSQIADGVARALEESANGFFDGKSSVVGTNGDARLGGCVAQKHNARDGIGARCRSAIRCPVFFF